MPILVHESVPIKANRYAKPKAAKLMCRPLDLPYPHENASGLSSNPVKCFRDPAFMDNKTLPLHRWVPWIAGFSATFVHDVIQEYLPGNYPGRVLDPFAGVGTTLLQAVLDGHEAVGFEINPYPALAARAKLDALHISVKDLSRAILAMMRSSKNWRSTPSPPGLCAPPLKSRFPFFSPRVEQQVLHLLGFIYKLPTETLRELFRAAFGAVMVSFSNYSYEPSLGSREAAGKPFVEDADVAGVMEAKLRDMLNDLIEIQPRQQHKNFGVGRVINSDFFSGSLSLPDRSVDLMITSPPYLNNYHYVRNTRPHLYWLNFISAPDQQKYLETGNFGKFWQTVRDAAPLELTFTHSELSDILRQLRQTRTEKGAYGGPGWANYVAAYFNDGFRLMSAMKRLLAKKGTGVVVVGNSIIQGINIEVERYLGEIAELNGLSLEAVYRIRDKRVGASITRSTVRQGERTSAVLSESAVVFHA